MRRRIPVVAVSLALSCAASAASAQSFPLGQLLDVIGRSQVAPAPQVAPPPPGAARRHPNAAQPRGGRADGERLVRRRGPNGEVQGYDRRTGRHTHTCYQSGTCMNYGGDDND